MATTVEDVLFGVEDALFAERARLMAEAAALEAVRLGQCALAVAVVGPSTAYLVGIGRLCRASDALLQAETRRDALLTAIDSIEVAVSRLPRIQELLSSDPDRAAAAAETMLGVVAAARRIGGLSEVLDDSVELLVGVADDARDAVGAGVSVAAMVFVGLVAIKVLS